MGNPYSKPEDRLRYINKDVNSIRASLKTSTQNLSKTRKDHLVERLAQHSSDATTLNGKVKRKEYDNVIKNISSAMQEVLIVETSSILDGGTVESNSFINVPVRKRTNSLGSLTSRKTATKSIIPSSVISTTNVPALKDIEAKADELKVQVGTAAVNKDSNLLRVYKQTIHVLAADLELIRAEKGTPFERRKQSVGKKLTSLYQKVNKSLNDLKNDPVQKNHIKQQNKQKALNDLADIELKLAENESLLDKMINEKNSANFPAIRNNIVENNQRLVTVDLIDNEIKEKVVLLSQKLTETVKNLDQIMAKREFESKFSKSAENFQRIIKNYDVKSHNKVETLQKLQNLRNSIENLEDLNDKTKTRKREFLNKINNHVEEITIQNNNADEDSDQKIIEDLVEDNVILRKKFKSSDKEHTVIDQFVNYWTNVRNNFNVNSYSHLSLLRIDNILEEMQRSIHEIRIKISQKCGTNLPTNLLLTKHSSQSVPKLNSLQNMDQIIKTTANVYNIPEKQIKVDNYVNTRFSKIEEIKLQVYYIKEKIHQNSNKKLLREKLEQCLKILEEYRTDSNQLVVNNSILVINEIIELMHQIIFEEFKEQINSFANQVESFSATTLLKDYQHINDSLLKTQTELENFNIPLQFEMLHKDKEFLLNEINNSLKLLHEKAEVYRRYGDDNLNKVKAKLQHLNDKVKRFSGTYKGVLYNQIERDLNKLLVDVEEEIDDKLWTREIIKEAEKLLKILEQRSSMAQSFKSNKKTEIQSEGQTGITKIKRDLVNIKKEIDRTSDNNVAAFLNFQSRLDLVNLELGQISARSNENLSKEKEIWSNEAQTLKNVVDAKVALGQQPTVRWPEVVELQHQEHQSYPKTDINKEIEQFEKAFNKIKEQISDVNAEEEINGKSLKELVERIHELIKNLQKYRFIRGTDLQNRQLTLLNEMQIYVEALEKDLTDSNFILGIEEKLKNLGQIFENSEDFDAIDLKNQLQKMQQEFNDHQYKSKRKSLQRKKSLIKLQSNQLFSKVKIAEDAQEKINKSLMNMEENMENLKQDIHEFAGLKSDLNYSKLSRECEETVQKLTKIVTKSRKLEKRKNQLQETVNILQATLQNKAEETEQVASLEAAENEISSTESNFSNNPENTEDIKLKLKEIEIRLKNLKVSKELTTRKSALMENLNILLNKKLFLKSSPLNSPNYASSIHNFMVSINLDEQILERLNKVEEVLQTVNDPKKLKELDETLTEIRADLKKLPSNDKTYELEEKLEDLTDIVEEKLQDSDRLTQINNEVTEISGKMGTPLTYEEIYDMDDKLNQSLISLRKIKNPALKSEVDACVMRIILCTNKTSEFLKTAQSSRV